MTDISLQARSEIVNLSLKKLEQKCLFHCYFRKNNRVSGFVLSNKGINILRHDKRILILLAKGKAQPIIFIF